MPDVRGETTRKALSTLAASDLCSIATENATWPAAKGATVGTIVDQDPVAGADVEPGTDVTLWFRGRSLNEGPYGSVIAPPSNCSPVYTIKNTNSD